ncbi:MAG: ATP/GTP-binding protein [Candidatus Methylacidiphilaceae bacterium]
MIVSFSLENWMSFRDQVKFLMVATRERQHGERVPHLAKYRTRVLPIAAIYGGNASGKTNFFRALSFAKKLVVLGTQPEDPISVEPFRLDAGTGERPSRFCFELLIGETIYEFSFAVTRKAVVEEKLVTIEAKRETVLYDRRDGKPGFSKALAKDDFLKFAFQGTRENQLFLTNAISQKVTQFRPVYDWFKNNLRLVAPDRRFGRWEKSWGVGHPFSSAMQEKLSELDTGIARLVWEEIDSEADPFLKSLKSRFGEALKEGESMRLPFGKVSRKAGELIVEKLAAYHPKADGTEAKFSLEEESDGTQRVIDLLPAFLDLSAKSSQKVYLIDELDRSLHTLLTRRLLEAYLAGCSHTTRSQLLFTTHDVLLMDQQLLRRDEMWVAERGTAGASQLRSFSEYKDVRYDKDIRKSYLQGRLGGIPRILLRGALTDACLSEESGEDG